MHYLIFSVAYKLKFFQNIDDILTLIKTPLDRFLHILGALTFRFKDLFDVLFFDTKFGKYENLQSLIHSTIIFSNLSQKVLKVISEMDKEQLQKFMRKILKSTNRTNEKHDIDIIYENFNSFLFKNNIIEDDNYFLGKNRSEFIDITKNIFKSIPEEILIKENLQISDYNFENDELIVVGPSFWKEENFIYAEIINFIINLKFKCFNAKVIFYCFEKINPVKLEFILNGQYLKKFEQELFISNFLNKLIRVNDGKIFYVIIKNFALFLHNCSSMEKYAMEDVSLHIEKYKKELSNIGNYEIKNLLYIIKVMIENN
ncbi:hypothetical protein GVAV_001590 [Gurleya vavrai]